MWDAIKAGQTNCVELKRQINNSEIGSETHKIMMIGVYEDGTKLKLEAVDSDKCGSGPWDFQGGATTFHR